MNEESVVQVNVPTMEVKWSDDFSADIDEKGTLTASQSFQCNADEAMGLLMTVKSCAQPGFTGLLLSGANFEHEGANVMRVTCKFGGANEDSPDDTDQSGGPTSSLKRATYDLTVSAADIPLTEHPCWAAMGDDPDWIPFIKAATAGTLRMTRIDDTQFSLSIEGSGNYKHGLVVEVGDRAYKLFKLLVKGVTKYRFNAQVLKISYVTNKVGYLPGGQGDPNLGNDVQPWEVVVSTRPKVRDSGVLAKDEWIPNFAKNAGGDRDWLFDGLNIKFDGAYFQISEHYTLSGQGGWNPDIYSEDNPAQCHLVN